MSIADLPKHRREEITTLEILRRNFRDQKESKNNSGNIVLEIPLADVNYEDKESISPIMFCRIARSFGGASIEVNEYDRYDILPEVHQSDCPETVTFCAITVPENFEKVCEELLQQAWGDSFSSAKTSLESKTIDFDDNEPAVVIDGKKYPIPAFKNEHFFCRVMFSYPPNESVDWSTIFKQMTDTESNNQNKDKRTVQDTMYAINNRIKKVANTDEDLFEWNSKSVKRLF